MSGDNPTSRIASILPVLARHEGVWDGWFRRIDPNGNKLEEFQTRVIVRYLSDDHWPNIYHQTNAYTLPNGVSQQIDTNGSVQDGRLVFASTRVSGWSVDDPTDPHRRSALMHMDFLTDPGLHMYEMMQISDCGRHRTRVAQFLRDGLTVSRTLIDETRVGDWRDLAGPAE
jgi:hypothetical protein